jgi:hypothetical protein
MLKFTLETNCIIAVDEDRPEVPAIVQLASAHTSGLASVGLVAISASERQVDGTYLENIGDFQKRIERLGLGNLELLKPMAYYGVTFWDFSLYSDDGMQALERQIHQILFPNICFLWADYCKELGLETTSPLDKRWKNAKCDVQAFWCHAYRHRNVFVTSDLNFHRESKKQLLESLSRSRIETPVSATELLSS